MSKVSYSHIFLTLCFLLTVETSFNLSCMDASNGRLYELESVEYVHIENCQELKLDLFKYIPSKILNLNIINVKNLSIVTGPQSLENIGNIFLIQSLISENTNFVSKAGSNIFIENCEFKKNLKIFSMGSDLLDGGVHLR